MDEPGTTKENEKEPELEEMTWPGWVSSATQGFPPVHQLTAIREYASKPIPVAVTGVPTGPVVGLRLMDGVAVVGEVVEDVLVEV